MANNYAALSQEQLKILHTALFEYQKVQASMINAVTSTKLICKDVIVNKCKEHIQKADTELKMIEAVKK